MPHVKKVGGLFFIVDGVQFFRSGKMSVILTSGRWRKSIWLSNFFDHRWRRGKSKSVEQIVARDAHRGSESSGTNLLHKPHSSHQPWMRIDALRWSHTGTCVCRLWNLHKRAPHKINRCETSAQKRPQQKGTASEFEREIESLGLKMAKDLCHTTFTLTWNLSVAFELLSCSQTTFSD